MQTKLLVIRLMLKLFSTIYTTMKDRRVSAEPYNTKIGPKRSKEFILILKELSKRLRSKLMIPFKFIGLTMVWSTVSSKLNFQVF